MKRQVLFSFFPNGRFLGVLKAQRMELVYRRFRIKSCHGGWGRDRAPLGQSGRRRGREAGGGTLPSPVPLAVGRRGVSLLAAPLVELEASLHRAVWQSVCVILFSSQRSGDSLSLARARVTSVVARPLPICLPSPSDPNVIPPTHPAVCRRAFTHTGSGLGRNQPFLLPFLHCAVGQLTVDLTP